MCAQLPVTYNLCEGPENDWITVETCSPIVISKNKCCADVKTGLFILVSVLGSKIAEVDGTVNYFFRISLNLGEICDTS